MSWLVVTPVAVSLLAVALVLALGATVRRAAKPDHDEAAALAALAQVEGPRGEPFFRDTASAVELVDALEEADCGASGTAKA